MPPRVSEHGRRRSRERLRLSTAATERMVARVRERGKPPAEFVGVFRRYLDGCARENNTRVLVYCEYVYVFGMSRKTDSETLVTVLPLPPRFRRILRRLRES